MYNIRTTTKRKPPGLRTKKQKRYSGSVSDFESMLIKEGKKKMSRGKLGGGR